MNAVFRWEMMQGGSNESSVELWNFFPIRKMKPRGVFWWIRCGICFKQIQEEVHSWRYRRNKTGPELIVIKAESSSFYSVLLLYMYSIKTKAYVIWGRFWILKKLEQNCVIHSWYKHFLSKVIYKPISLFSQINCTLKEKKDSRNVTTNC